MPLSLEHERAKEAYEKVSSVIKNLGVEEKKEFKSWAKKFPSMVVSCGLLQAALFYNRTTKKTVANQLYEVLNEYIRGYVRKKLNYSNDENFDLVDYLLKSVSDVRTYLYLSAESVKFLTWVKNFTEALL
jgi:CRISPR type III-B/RAMP module-associated protein Cmr5